MTKFVNKKYTTSFLRAIIRKNPNRAQVNLFKANGAALAIAMFVLFAPLSGAFAALTAGGILARTFLSMPMTSGILGLNSFICNYGLQNTGVACIIVQKTGQSLWLTPQVNNYGTQNGIRTNGTVATTTNGTFTMPGFGFTVAVTYTSTAGFYQGMVFYGADSTGHTGWFEITSITSATVAVTKNIGIVGQSAQGVTVATAMVVSDVVTWNTNFFINMVNHPDPSRRIYPSPLFKNATNKRGPSQFKTYDDLTKAKIQQSPREWMSMVVGKYSSPQSAASMQNTGGVPFAAYVVDKDSNFLGQVDNPSNIQWLYPAAIDGNSLDVLYNPGDDKTEPETSISFNFDNSIIIDANWNGLAGSLNGVQGDLDPGVNLLRQSQSGGLLTIKAVISAIATSSAGTFTMALQSYYGSANTPVNDLGLVVSNFISPVTGLAGKIYDQTAGADVAITSCTEVLANGRPTGVYNILLASDPSAADKLSVGLARNGRDYSSIHTLGGSTVGGWTFASV